MLVREKFYDLTNDGHLVRAVRLDIEDMMYDEIVNHGKMNKWNEIADALENDRQINDVEDDTEVAKAIETIVGYNNVIAYRTQQIMSVIMAHMEEEDFIKHVGDFMTFIETTEERWAN